ncbi:MAG: redoxin domain-containing protein [Bacteroidales bacterium]|nr:redoxin domain-containing protein [Bacteroidales bacterium]
MRKTLHLNFSGIVLIIIFSLAGCRNRENPNQSIIKTNFSYSASNKVYLHELLPDSWPVLDSAITDKEGSVEFKLSLADAGLYTIGTGRDNLVILQVDPGQTQKLTTDIRQIPWSYDITGSKGSKLLEKFKEQTLRHLDEIDSLYLELNTRHDSSVSFQYKTRIDSLVNLVYQKQKDFQIDLVRQNKSILAVLIPLFQPFGRKPVLTVQSHSSLFMQVYDNLKRRYPNNPHVLELHKRIQQFHEQKNQEIKREKKLQPSLKAPDFSFSTINGKTVNLSDLKGNYILLDFWSENNPDYKRKKEKIYQIQTNYSNVIHLNVYHGKDKLVWKNMATKFKDQSIHSTAGKMALTMYNAEDNDRVFLISPKGIILTKDVKTSMLKAVLEENI